MRRGLSARPSSVMKRMTSGFAPAMNVMPKVVRADAAFGPPDGGPVARLMLQRHLEGSVPGARSDGFKLGLAIEGGGMRGVVSAGMVCALEQLGMLNVFDAIYGSSAGAAIAAYFSAGQARYATSIYYENVNNRRFIDPLRFFAGKPIISLSYLIDQVGIYEKILDWKGVVASKVPVNFIASSVGRARPVRLGAFRTREDVLDGLRASLRIPLFGGGPHPVGDDRYFDGACLEPVPIGAAIEDGCTHVLVLLSSARLQPHWLGRVADRVVMARYLAGYSADFAQRYLERRANGAMRVLGNAKAALDEHGAHVEVLAPGAHQRVRSIEKRRNVLVAGAKAGMAAAYRLMRRPTPQLVEIIGVYDYQPGV
jgi:predicted patatin/cPLA2 family phospholipase